MNCDIVLVKSGNQKQIYGELSAYEFTALEPPLWLAITAAFLRGLGVRVEVLDAEVENLSYEKTALKVKELSPLLCVVMVSGSNPSASTMNMTGAAEIVSHLRRHAPQVYTAFAGLHPSALPLETMLQEKADFVIQGEGFYTFPKLIEALKAQSTPKGIPGLWRREDGRIIHASYPRLLEDLNTIPAPAWDMLPMERYRAHNWHCFGHIENRQPYAVLYTSLGCPFKCAFCCINALFGKNIIRYRRAKTVIREVDFLVNTLGVRNIKLIDEMFAMNEKRVASICDPLIERGYDLNIWAYARVNTVTPGMLAKMKKAGINWVAYGLESGNENVIKDVGKGYRMDEVLNTVKMTRNEGIHICSNFIFGLPEDDYDTMNDTLSLMLAINSEWANIYCAMAYPGSKLYEMAREKNWPLPETWQAYSQYAPESKPLPTRFLSSRQVLSFRDYAFGVYYKSPRYLRMIRETFGERAMESVQKMCLKRLVRNHLEI